MKKYTEMTQEELRSEYEALQKEYLKYCSEPLSLNMARGKPSPAQLDLSMPMMDVLDSETKLNAEDGTAVITVYWTEYPRPRRFLPICLGLLPKILLFTVILHLI